MCRAATLLSTLVILLKFLFTAGLLQNASCKGRTHNFILVTGVMNKRSKLMSSGIMFFAERRI
jgi:hypothetical protein